MSELKIHSDKAWEIASHFSDVLASSTRTLAAMIDVALAEAAEVANQEQKPVAFIISGVLAELKKHKDASGTVWSGLNDRHPFIHEATALYASPVRTTPPPSSHVEAAQPVAYRWRWTDSEAWVLTREKPDHVARVVEPLFTAPAPSQHLAPDAAARLERILRLGRSMKWTPHGAPALDDENTAVALGELFQIFFQDAVDRALATTEGQDNG